MENQVVDSINTENNGENITIDIVEQPNDNIVEQPMII